MKMNAKVRPLFDHCNTEETNNNKEPPSLSKQAKSKIMENNYFEFLHGSTLNSGCLLGLEEMEKYLSNRKALIHITTWNMGSLPLANEYQLGKLFQHKFEDETLKKIDIHVISIQECFPDIDAWELELQSSLGSDFLLFHSLSFGTLHLSIFIRRDLIWFTTEAHDTTLSVRSGRLFKTKGSAAVKFNFFGTKFLFINAHLSAGEEKARAKQRVEELKKIILTNQRDNSNVDIMFLCGDLNFRIKKLKRDEIIDLLRESDISPLLEKDELNSIFNRRDHHPHTNFKFLEYFQEAAAITFRPTYKYDINSDTFDSSTKRRCPAFTDRIIYKSKNQPNGESMVLCQAYDIISNLRASDHRPVFSIFSVEIKPGCDTMSITGGKYKRELYVKSIQNRARFLIERRKKLATSVCLIS